MFAFTFIPLSWKACNLFSPEQEEKILVVVYTYGKQANKNGDGAKLGPIDKMD